MGTTNWFTWALLSAFFAGLTAVLAKVGVAYVNSNLATAIRTVVILIFAWSVALFTSSQSISTIGRRTWVFLVLIVLAAILLHERLTWHRWLGGLLVSLVR